MHLAKTVAVLTIFLATAKCRYIGERDDGVTDITSLNNVSDINSNFLSDKIIEKLHKIMIGEGYDPANLPNFRKDFSYLVGFITVHGLFGLQNGYLNGASGFERKENSLYYLLEKPKLRLEIPIEFDSVSGAYDFYIRTMGLIDEQGEIIIDFISGIKATITAEVNTETEIVNVIDFEVNKKTFIAIRIRGITSPTKLRIIDRVLSEFVSQALQSFIVGKVEAFVKQFIMEHLSSFSLES